MIGFENFSPSSWLESIFVVQAGVPARDEGRGAAKRNGKWVRYIAVGAIGALVAGAQLELPFSSGVSSPSMVSRAKREDAVGQDIAQLRQGIADLRRQIRRGVLESPDVDTLALATEVAERSKARGLDKSWAEEVAKSFLG